MPADTDLDPSSQQLIEQMREKAQGIFLLCDKESKGFVTEKELLALENELPLDSDQLRAVFRRLDSDGSGSLTLDKFSNGFGNFLGLTDGNANLHDNPLPKSPDDMQDFAEVELNLADVGLSDNADIIHSIWSRLHQSQPEVCSNFERLIRTMLSELTTQKMSYQQLQMSFENKTMTHNDEMESLYEEMERLMAEERKRLDEKGKSESGIVRERMQKELREKDDTMRDLITQQTEMNDRLSQLSRIQEKMTHENQRLQKEKEEMEEKLKTSENSLMKSNSYVEKLAKLQNDENKDKLMMLNQQLVDERDEAIESLLARNSLRSSLRSSLRKSGRNSLRSSMRSRLSNKCVDASLTSELDSFADVSPIPNKWEEVEATASDPTSDTEQTTRSYWWDKDDELNSLERQQPLGSDFTSDVEDELITHRLYKIVFIGDSGVGKTAFLHRVCRDTFNPAFASTIGVDFQVYHVTVEDHTVALQLWDTAGQERFRSFTKQYFRKADGIIIFYDVTSQKSFLNVKQWIHTIKKEVDDDIALALVGNKMDLDSRIISREEGQSLAEEQDTLFYEVSSKTGENCIECLQAMSRILKASEDKELQNTLKLSISKNTPSEKKRTCCNRPNNTAK